MAVDIAAARRRLLREYKGKDSLVRLPLGADWRVSPRDELLARLRELAGSDGVCVLYAEH